MASVGYGETWAKAILMGEHSVVYGYPAVAVPIRQLTMRAWAKPVAGEHCGEGGVLRALDYSGPLRQAGDRFGGVVRAVDVARRFAGKPDAEFDIMTECSFPAGRGMGSSAASAGAVIRAVLDSCGVHAGRRQLMELTQQAEVVTHGNPSGLDTVTTCSPVPVSFTMGKARPLNLKADAHLVIADSGVVGSTREAVNLVRKQREHDESRVVSIMNRLGWLAKGAQGDLECGDMPGLGERMTAAHGLLSRLGVSHPVLDVLVAAAQGAGALGSKLTGGGLGGCMVALCATRREASDVREALLCAGAVDVWVHRLRDAALPDGQEPSEFAGTGHAIGEMQHTHEARVTGARKLGKSGLVGAGTTDSLVAVPVR